MWQPLIRLFTLSLLSLIPYGLQAGGIMLYEISSPDIGFASAGWGSRCNDASTVFTNPAGMSRFCGRQVEFGAQAIHQHVKFEPHHSTISGSDGNASQWIPSGSLFYVQPINACWTFGVGCLSYFGAELDFNHNWVGRYYITKSQLQSLSIVPALSYEINDCLSIGLGANIMGARFEQKSAINNSAEGLPDGQFKVKDENVAVGLVAGILYQFTPCTRIGLQYLSSVHLKFEDRLHFEDIGLVLALKLSATGLLDSRIHIKANVPQSLMLSLYHDINPCWAVMADIGWQQWSKFEKSTIILDNPDQTSLTVTPHYKDTWHAAVGAQYFYNSCWSFTGGIAYDSSAVNTQNRPFDFAVGRQWRIGTGFSWQFSPCFVFRAAYEFQWTGNLPVHRDDGPLVGNVSGDFNDLSAHFLNFNLVWAF